jgi:DNA-binding transcriptional LysR family regulator
MRLNNRQIEAFRATVALGSVTAAAESLFVTQPAISRLLSDLEHDLGFALFERYGRGLRPTLQGRLLYEEVERSYIGLQAVRERAELIRNGRIGLLRVAVMPAFAETFAAPALGAVLRDAPEIGVELDVLNTTAIVDGVRRHRFDLGVAAPVFVDPSLTWTILRSAEMVAALPHDHPLAGAERIAPEDLVLHEVLALPLDSPYRLQLQMAVARFAGRTARITSTARTQTAACEMIAAGCRAMAIVDPCIAARYGADVVIKPLAFELRSDLAICSLNTAESSPAKAFRRCLEACISKADRPPLHETHSSDARA